MPPVIQVGAILIDDWPLMIKLRALETEPFSGNWSLVKALDGLALDRKIRASGWNFFFMAAEVKAMFLGAKKIQNALKRILKEVKQQHFNSLEVAAIVAKRFLGVPLCHRVGTLSVRPGKLLLGERLNRVNTRGVVTATIASSFSRSLAEGVHGKRLAAQDGIPCRAGPAQGSARSRTFVHSGHGFFVQVPVRERKGF